MSAAVRPHFETDLDGVPSPRRFALVQRNTAGRPPEDEAHLSLVRESQEATGPFETDGVAVNFLGRGGDERIHATDGENYDRLVELENERDPRNRFRIEQTVAASA